MMSGKAEVGMMQEEHGKVLKGTTEHRKRFINKLSKFIMTIYLKQKNNWLWEPSQEQAFVATQ